jgi:hypothetical protein
VRVFGQRIRVQYTSFLHVHGHAKRAYRFVRPRTYGGARGHEEERLIPAGPLPLGTGGEEARGRGVRRVRGRQQVQVKPHRHGIHPAPRHHLQPGTNVTPCRSLLTYPKVSLHARGSVKGPYRHGAGASKALARHRGELQVQHRRPAASHATGRRMITNVADKLASPTWLCVT